MKKKNYLFEFKAGANHAHSAPITTICLDNSLVENAKTITGKDFSFILHTQNGKSYFFRSASAEEMDQWMNELSSASHFHLKKAGSMSPKYAESPHPSLPQQQASQQPGESRPQSVATRPTSVHTQSKEISFDKMTREELAQAMPILNFLESFTDGVVVSNSSGIIIGVNSALEKMFGWDQGELMGKSVNVLMPEPYASQHDAYMFRHEKFGDEKLIGKLRNIVAKRSSGEVFKIQISLGKLPIKGFFIATIRERLERS